MSTAITFSRWNPGSTESSCRDVRRISPAAISSTTASAISVTTSAEAARRARRLALTRPGATSASPVRSAAAPAAEIRPNTSVVSTARPSVNASTPRLRPASASPGTPTLSGTSATSAGTPQYAATRPTTPAATARTRLSAMSCARIWPRLAPSATRSAISCRRPSARASSRLPTFAHAISRTTPTAPSISTSGCRVLPTSSSRSETA